MARVLVRLPGSAPLCLRVRNSGYVIIGVGATVVLVESESVNEDEDCDLGSIILVIVCGDADEAEGPESLEAFVMVS